MATITGLTAQRMLEIESRSIVAARKDGSNLILTTHGGDDIYIGHVDGRGIRGTNIGYQLSTSPSETPIGPWFETIPELLPGYYLWVKTTLDYTDGTSTPSYGVSRIGKDGAEGSPPSTPVNVRVISNTPYYDKHLGATSTLVLGWDPVTTSLDSEPLDVASYEIFNDGVFVTAVSEPTAVLLLPSLSTVDYQVRALSVSGLHSDLSPGLTVTTSILDVVLKNPTKPSLSTNQGVLVAGWDGLYTQPKTDLDHYVVLEIQNGSGWDREGVPTEESGSFSCIRPVGSIVTARFSAFDKLGRLTGRSTTTSITIIGVGLSDLDSDVNDFFDNTIVDIQEEYAANTSRLTPPTMGWSQTPPTLNPLENLWKRLITTTAAGLVSIGRPSLATAQDGEDGILLKIISSRGTAFKNSLVDTTLDVTIYKGADTIVNVSQLHTTFGVGSFLEWRWLRIDDDEEGVISSSDARLSRGGFTLTVAPSDVDGQTTFKCVLHT